MIHKQVRSQSHSALLITEWIQLCIWKLYTEICCTPYEENGLLASPLAAAERYVIPSLSAMRPQMNRGNCGILSALAVIQSGVIEAA